MTPQITALLWTFFSSFFHFYAVVWQKGPSVTFAHDLWYKTSSADIGDHYCAVQVAAYFKNFGTKVTGKLPSNGH